MAKEVGLFSKNLATSINLVTAVLGAEEEIIDVNWAKNSRGVHSEILPVLDLFLSIMRCDSQM